MPHYTVSRIAEILGAHGTVLNKANILILGVAFKENISDTRNSPALRVMELLAQKGSNVAYLDQNDPKVELNGKSVVGVNPDMSSISAFDAVVILVSHDGVDLAQIVENAKLGIDTRNAAGRLLGPRPNVVKV